MKNKLISISFIAFSALYLLLLLLGKTEIARYLKPFLLPILLILVYAFQDFKTKKNLLTALTFSWIGYLFLLFVDKGKIYFNLGLLAFIISHIYYIVLFQKQSKTQILKHKFVFLIGIALILTHVIVLLSVLLPNIENSKIPITIYAFVLSTMLFFALKGSLHWSKPANFFVLLGAVLFVTSDSILAINKFYMELPNATFWIMLTYLSAQFCITFGILQLNIKSRH